MAGYTPINIKANETGLVQDRQNFLLPNDAYPVLENAFLWREQIRRKQGCQFLGRLRRLFDEYNFFETSASPYTQNFLTVSGYVVAADNANPGKITTSYPHQLTNGDVVVITGIVGATGYNNVEFTITVVSPTVFSVGVNAAGFGAYVSGGKWISNRPVFGVEENATIEPGSVILEIADVPPIILTDQGNGTLTSSTPGNSGTINYSTGSFEITTTAPAGTSTVISYNYFPNIPVMGLRSRELTSTNNEQTVAFDQKYAYIFSNGYQEFLPGTTWIGDNSDFFWTTNYWVSANNRKVFWATNFSGTSGDPIRYTDGIGNWVNFSPALDGVAPPNTTRLQQCLCMLPFRGRLVVFNTLEGVTLASSVSYTNRIRWAAIGNPFSETSSIVSTVNANAWRDDIRGQGGYLDIPTSEDIISVGFVRDNLVIYCERSTWQLRYTGRSIAPFQIEKVNSELGAESTFSAVQFDTSLVGIGDKGVVECDSFKSERIDIKIPDLVFRFSNQNNGTKRVHGIRDFVMRLAYWTYPDSELNSTFPNKRLVYNYENDSWAIFTDSFTCLGNYQPQTTRTWANTPIAWQEANFTWTNQPSLIPQIVAGNQQGYVVRIGGGFATGQTSNDETLYIKDITGFGTLPTSNPVVITSPDHNLQNGQIIEIVNIPTSTPFATELNNKKFQVNKTGDDTFYLTYYNSVTEQYDKPALAPVGVFIGYGQIKVRDNFSVVSKKFNYMDKGMQFQLGFVDVLLDVTRNGAITMNVYTDYNDGVPINNNKNSGIDDSFFNNVVPTNADTTDGIPVVGGDKNWKRVVCPTNANFVTIQWTLNNEQMQNQCQESDVQIDAQIIWSRPGGRMGITR